jgi:uncharacterized protein YjiS (DUF1127 family)
MPHCSYAIARQRRAHCPLCANVSQAFPARFGDLASFVLQFSHGRATEIAIGKAPGAHYVASHQTKRAGLLLPTRLVAQKGNAMSIKLIAHKVSEWLRYRHSVRELTRLSDRELADLGLNRADIAHVARKAAGI